jgi:hypothetical protein
MKRRLIALVVTLIVLALLLAPAVMAYYDHGGSGTAVPTWQAGWSWCD